MAKVAITIDGISVDERDVKTFLDICNENLLCPPDVDIFCKDKSIYDEFWTAEQEYCCRNEIISRFERNDYRCYHNSCVECWLNFLKVKREFCEKMAQNHQKV